MMINVVDPEEIRVAITGADGLEELYLERTGKGFHAGNIYKGIIQNIEPNLQAAFVDIGGEKNAFLHVSDVIAPDGGYKGILKKRGGRRPTAKDGKEIPIEKMLWKGQEVLVQITREAFSTKGPSVTTYVSLPGRYLVLMPSVAKRGVSKKIQDGAERDELLKALKELDPPKDKGFIIRTAGMGKGTEELKNDLDYLLRLWKAIERKTKEETGPTLIYEETDLVIRSIRDFLRDDIQELLLDGEAEYEKAREFLETVMPAFKDRTRYYGESDPMFHHYGVATDIEKVFSREVPLKSGGELIIESTEAMVTIDVNSGKSHKTDDSREMILRTNKEAAAAVARQLRLRDLGGLVMIDFIDMDQEEDRREVENDFREALAQDRARLTVLPISRLGVMEMTRQRVRQSLRTAVFSTCPNCGGAGITKSLESLGLDFIRSLRRKLGEKQGQWEARMHPKAASYIQNERRHEIADLEREYSSRVSIKTDMDLPFDQIEFSRETAEKKRKRGRGR
jgi:ribonuclease E